MMRTIAEKNALGGFVRAVGALRACTIAMTALPGRIRAKAAWRGRVGAEKTMHGRVHAAALAALATSLALAGGTARAQPDDAPVPPVTDEDRAAAFPDLGDEHAQHMMLERPLNYLVAFDHLERHDTAPDATAVWGLDAWVGNSTDRLLVRIEGERSAGTTAHADLELLWRRAVTRWWNVTAGARRDFGPGPERDWAAVGVEGLAPFWLELEATAYVGEGGRTAARVEAEHELLITQRLVLQPRLEMEWYGRDDPALGRGAGLASTEAGIRLRYEIRREIAPYVGYVWRRRHGATAELARAAGEHARDRRFVAGIRVWF